MSRLIYTGPTDRKSHSLTLTQYACGGKELCLQLTGQNCDGAIGYVSINHKEAFDLIKELSKWAKSGIGCSGFECHPTEALGAEVKRLEGMVNAAVDQREEIRTLWDAELNKRGAAERQLAECQDLLQKIVDTPPGSAAHLLALERASAFFFPVEKPKESQALAEKGAGDE